MTRAPLFTGPYDVDVDLTYAEIDTLRRRDSPDVRHRLKNDETDYPALIADAHVILETHPDITPSDLTERLGVSASTYDRRIAPHLHRRIPPDEAVFLAVLDRLIATGDPFTVEALPAVGDAEGLRCRTILDRERRAGRIRTGGRSRDGAVIWHPTPTQAAA